MASREQLKQALMETAESMELLKPNFKGLIYGESGVGKTVSALQVAQAIRKIKGGKILYVDAAEGWVSLQNHPELKDGVTRLKYLGRSQLDLISELYAEGDEWAKEFTVAIFDEISVMATKDLDVVVAANAKNDSDKDPDTPVWPDMNANTHRMRKTVNNFLVLDLDQIYVSHIREDEDKAKGYKITRPEFMPKLNVTIRNGLHLVAHARADIKVTDGRPEYSRSMQVHPTKTVVAKSRIGGMGVYTTMKDFIPVLVEWMHGNVDEVDEQIEVDDTTPVGQYDADPAIVVN